jgi:hypothetical protein
MALQGEEEGGTTAHPRADRAMPPPDLSPAHAPAAPLAEAVLPSSQVRWLFWSLAALPGVLFLAIVLSPPMNHDVAAVLDFSMRWRNGELLFRDLIDMNPPLVFLLTRGAVAAGGALGLGPIHSVLAGALAVCTLGAGLALWLRRGLAAGPIEIACVSVGLPLILLTAGYDFAQREHLMLAASLPYLVLAARRAEGVPTSPVLSLAVALLAAVFLALKPHFLAIPALVELYVLVRTGPRAALRDPVPWSMAALWLAYLALIRWGFPDYLNFALPLALAYYHSPASLSEILLNERMAPALLLMLPAAFLALRHPRGLAPTLALAGLGAVAAAVVQGRGWSYHVMPFKLLGGLLVVVLVARWLDANLRNGARCAPAVAALAAGFLALQGLLNPETWRAADFERSWPGAITAEVRRIAEGGRVLVLSPDIHPIFPALNYAHALSTLPTMNDWLVQAANQQCLPNGARYREPAEMGPGERLIWDSVTRDFVQHPPEALLIARHTAIPYCGRDFDNLEYFSRDPGFAATLRRYRQTAEFADYRFFRREDP